MTEGATKVDEIATRRVQQLILRSRSVTCGMGRFTYRCTLLSIHCTSEESQVNSTTAMKESTSMGSPAPKSMYCAPELQPHAHRRKPSRSQRRQAAPESGPAALQALVQDDLDA
jgi:hypothetical protein